MPSNDYIPRRDEDFRNWAVQFTRNIHAHPERFLMTPAQSEFLKQAVDDFILKYEIATNELTATRPAIAAKQDARSVAESLCRTQAMLIRPMGGVSDQDKISLGVRPLNPRKTPRRCPQTSPILTVIGCTPGLHSLEYRDPTMGKSSDKPTNAMQMQLFIAITDQRGTAPLSEAKFARIITRSQFDVDYTEADDGRWATYYGRWASRRGETGPWSLPVSMSIAA